MIHASAIAVLPIEDAIKQGYHTRACSGESLALPSSKKTFNPRAKFLAMALGDDALEVHFDSGDMIDLHSGRMPQSMPDCDKCLVLLDAALERLQAESAAMAGEFERILAKIEAGKAKLSKLS